MKYPVYCIRDKHTGFFPNLMLESNDVAARRGFAYAVNNGDNVMNFAPDDYDLYKLGVFDTDSGKTDLLDLPEFIVSGSSLVGD